MWKLLIVTSVIAVSYAAKLQEVFRWRDVDFAWPSEQAKQEALQNQRYIPANNLPLGLARWKNKLFITIPRWKAGVASSLNYIPLNTSNSSPALIPYPSLKANTLPTNGEKLGDDRIVSTFRVEVDACDRLWVMDTGLADILGSGDQHSKPALVVFDLNTDRLLRRYEFKPEDLKDSSFFC
uniref:Bee-milk protein n=1 Tax=Photinus pyralis TaxID=7054 RepID=A0A1Y1LHU6_PHOPY